ncbi:MAG: TatD family hydrolase [Clostridia bacterium]
MIDSHAHICDIKLHAQRQTIIDEMACDALDAIVEVGADFESSKEAVELAEANDNIFAVIGTHPEGVEYFCEEDCQFYKKTSESAKVVAIGEIGLDYFYGKDDIDQQKAMFERQLQLAIEVNLPVVLHIRDAYKDALDILTKYKSQLSGKLLLHCYSASAEMVNEFDKLDCYYAVGGAITFKNAKKDDVIRAIKRDRLLVETDCPYMAPTPFRGQVNQPKYVAYVVEKIAEVLNLSVAEVDKLTQDNTLRFFGKMQLKKA